MEVLLVNTNRMKPPIAPVALDYLCSALTAKNHQVSLLDFCLEGDAHAAAEKAFAHAAYDLVALTFRNTDDCYYASGQSFHDVLRDDVRLIRQHHDGPLVVGGCGFSLMPQQLLEHAGADLGIAGEGEESLPKLLDAVRGHLPYSSVPGLVFKAGRWWSGGSPCRARVDRLDLSARGLVDNRTYFARGGQIGVETKRGCPGQCIYCADPVIKGKASRVRSPRQVVQEFQNLLSQGADHFHLCDCEFNLPADHAAAVCEAIIAAGLGDRMRWYAYLSPVPFSEELAALMRKAGCAGINFGVDSGSDAQLARLGRHFRVVDLIETARICGKLGITLMYDLLLGAPGETSRTLAETIDLMKTISPDRVGISLGVRIYAGTRLAEMAQNGELDEAGIRGNVGGLEPVFYVSPAFGPDPSGLVREMIGKDERFFVPSGKDEQDYNYNDNAVLQRAIDSGCRGAYWDILRRLSSVQLPKTPAK